MPDSHIDIVHFLASRACNGRRTGTPGSEVARNYIIKNMEKARILAFNEDGSYTHSFDGLPNGEIGTNIIGIIPGRGAMAERIILVDAHYDHLGRHKTGLRYYPGANDNAAAVAAIIHAAALLNEMLDEDEEERRSVLFCCFDAEEPPYFRSEHMGAAHFCKDRPDIVERIDLAIILDLLAHRMGEGRVPEKFQEIFFVIGAEKSGLAPLLDSMAEDIPNLSPMRIGAHAIPPSGDYVPLQEYHLPYLFITAGKFTDYHTCYDTAEKLDYPKLRKISEYLANLLKELVLAGPACFEYQRLGEDDLATLLTMRDIFSRMDDKELASKNKNILQFVQKRIIRGDIEMPSKLENIKDFLERGIKKCQNQGSLDHNERSRINYLIEVIAHYMH